MKALFSGVSEKVKTPLQSLIPRKLTSHDSPQNFLSYCDYLESNPQGQKRKAQHCAL